MKFADVQNQLEEIFSRAIRSGISVKQNRPAVSESATQKSIGELKSSAIALRDIPYKDIYTELERLNQYHIKLGDGALLLFQYKFDASGNINKHRLGYFPCPTLPSQEDAPELYAKDSPYTEAVLHRVVRFPIRFDFDPKNYAPVTHAHSHLTLGQFDNCRIPASHPLSPNGFFLFVVRNLYYGAYKRNRNIFDRKITSCPSRECITEAEKKLTTLLVGR